MRDIPKTLDEVLEITPQAIALALDGLPEDKIHCSNLAAGALRAAVRHFRSKIADELSAPSR